jgi:hypothetical protein
MKMEGWDLASSKLQMKKLRGRTQSIKKYRNLEIHWKNMDHRWKNSAVELGLSGNLGIQDFLKRDFWKMSKVRCGTTMHSGTFNM